MNWGTAWRQCDRGKLRVDEHARAANRTIARGEIPRPLGGWSGERDLARPGCQNPGADIGEFTAHRDRTGHHVWYRLLQGNGLVPPEARVSRVPHLPDIHRRTDVRQPNACRSDQMHGQPLNASRCGSADTLQGARSACVNLRPRGQVLSVLSAVSVALLCQTTWHAISRRDTKLNARLPQQVSHQRGLI